MPKLLSLGESLEQLAAGPLAAGRHSGTGYEPQTAATADGGAATDSLPRLLDAAHWAPGCGQGVRLAVDQAVEERFLQADRIAIEFPAFNDGRGLSLAVLLRSRYGYTGDIMATGDIHEDLLHYLRRCGFTSFLMPDERNLETVLATLAPYSDYYQASVVEPEPAFRRIGRGG